MKTFAYFDRLKLFCDGTDETKLLNAFTQRCFISEASSQTEAQIKPAAHERIISVESATLRFL